MAGVPFRLRRLAWAVSAALAAGEALAVPAGRVDFAIGNVTVTGADGRSRAAAKGTEVESGDRIVTGDGRAQVRFTDGAFVSLQPNTDFAIREYRYDGRTDGSERGVFGLVRGAFRTVTGAIGRVNRRAYEVQTPTATIGIRGTGGLIQVLADGTTLIVGTSGTWSLTNPAGSIDVPAGRAARAGPNPQVPPAESAQSPVLPPAQGPLQLTALPSPPNTFIAGDDVLPNGFPSSLAGVGCSVCDASITYSNLTSALQPTGFSSVLVTFDSSGAATQIGSFSLGAGGSAVDVGNKGDIAWGRWIGTVNGIPGTFSANQGFHYVVGLPPPSMPTIGIVGFSSLGATRPTVADGSEPPGSFAGQMVVDFGAGKVGLAFSTAFSTFNVSVTSNGGVANPSSSEVSFPVGTPRFQGVISSFGGVSGNGPFAICISAGCSAKINGGFSGTGASSAGFTYEVSSPSPGKVIHGAAAFNR